MTTSEGIVAWPAIELALTGNEACRFGLSATACLMSNTRRGGCGSYATEKKQSGPFASRIHERAENCTETFWILYTMRQDGQERERWVSFSHSRLQTSKLHETR